MPAGSKPKYYLVEASVLPEIFAKVIEAKELLETGEVRTVAQAVARVDISRSAFYKYKDYVSPFQDMSRGHLVTFNMELRDRQGVLSSVLAIFAGNGANILTINQSIPTSGVAPVTITAATENMRITMEAFLAAVKAIHGVLRIDLVAGLAATSERARSISFPAQAETFLSASLFFLLPRKSSLRAEGPASLL